MTKNYDVTGINIEWKLKVNITKKRMRQISRP